VTASTELDFDETSRFLNTPKGDLHYHVAGDGPPILLLHGSGPGVSGWANFRGNLPVFAEDFTTYLLDMPGFGKSYTTETNPLFSAPAAVLDFLDGLGLDDALPIVGNSMGGNVAARIAAEQPERISRLVTIGGIGLPLFTPSPPEGIKLLVEFVEDPTYDRLRTWMESMVYDVSILTDEFVELRWKAATDPAQATDIKKLYNRAMLQAMRNRSAGAADSIALLTRIQAPSLVMYGRDDRVTPLDSALVAMRLIKLCELHVFYDCGHWAMIERKAEFEDVVRGFLLRDRPSGQ
jgi:2-hydroxy-6-oxonona-2,4-dienedioate hydrolase